MWRFNTGKKYYLKGLKATALFMMIFTIEGNIGAGKSVYAKFLVDTLKSSGFRVIHIEEPVNDWINFNGNNLLKLLYDDKKRWAFPFQINALFNAKHTELAAIKYSQDKCVVIMERSSFSVFEIFCKYFADTVFHPVENTIIERLKNKTFKTLEEYTDHVIVYFKTPPEVCMERIYRRSREEEIQKIDLDYINRLHSLHENGLTQNGLKKKVLIISGDSYNDSCIEDAKIFSDNSLNALEVFYDILAKWHLSRNV